MRQIVMIGAGNIGSRTLQSLATYSQGEPLKVWLVDPNAEALALSEQRAHQIEDHQLDLVKVPNMNDLPKRCDFAVVSTTAGPRLAIMSDLLSVCIPERLLLEKFLFQHKDHYDAAAALLKTHAIKTYVNCPRPAWPGYVDIRERVADDPRIDMRVTGANWALASNAIHFVALFDFLTGHVSTSFDDSRLDPEPVTNKRAGYMDVKGEISSVSPRGDTLSMMSWPDGSGDIIVHIRTASVHAIINEAQGKMQVQTLDGWTDMPFKALFASQMENSIDAILNDKPCLLPAYADIVPAHLALIPSFNGVFFKDRASDELCPVT